jgi:hypothetical protein
MFLQLNFFLERPSFKRRKYLLAVILLKYDKLFSLECQNEV